MTRLTANLSTLIEGNLPSDAKLWITAPSVSAGGRLHAGGLQKVPFRNGRIDIELLSTDSEGSDPISWMYGFQVKWSGGSLPKFYAEVTGETVDLADLQHLDPAAPEYVPQVVEGPQGPAGIQGPAGAPYSSPNLIQQLMSVTPFYIGHRGSGDYWPEHTMTAYQGAISAGAKAIEVSVWELPDGTWVCNHDSTIDRTVVGLTGSVQRLSGPAVSSLKVRHSGVLGPAYEAGVPMTTLAEVLERFGGRVVIFLENKQGFVDRAMRMLDVVERLVPDAQKSVVYKTVGHNNAKTGLADGIVEARERGFKAWGYMDAGISSALVDTIAAEVDYLGIPIPDPSVVGLTSMTDAEVSYVVSKGKPVIGWEVHRRHQVAKYVALGVKGMMCSGIPYVTRSTAMQTEDQFDLLSRQPGDLPRVYLPEYCANYAVNGSDGELVIKSQYVNSVLMGSMSPIAAGSYYIEFEIKWDVLPGATSHAGIAFGKVEDDFFIFGNAANVSGGYHLIFRANGQIGLYTHAPGNSAGTLLGAALNTTAAVAGTWAKIRVEVAPTTVAFQRLDGTPSAKESRTTNAFRGGYFHLSRNHDANSGEFVRFRNVRTGSL